jgi:tetratricopeptide (TPR) repeat protein
MDFHHFRLTHVGLRPSKNTWLFGLLLIVITFVVYQPVWHAGFIWDDDNHLTNNPCIVGPLGFKAIWTTSQATYYPLVLTSFWIQHALWGLNPLPFHLVNVAVHGTCAVLTWRVLLKLNVRGAWLGAAIWALHPVNVESVAWVTELKNTQSCFFYLLGILFFLEWLKQRASNGATVHYVLALVCAVAAILSKSSTVMLPVVLGLCWWWLEGRWRSRNVAWLTPFLIISLVASGWTIWEQQFHSGAVGAEWAYSWTERLVIAGKAFWFYLGKLAWPHPLVFVYSLWKIDASGPLAYLPLLIAAAGLCVLWRYRNTQSRALFFGFAYFVISLFPVLGFFNIYFFRYSFVGDHFQYLASMGPLALAGAGIVTVLDDFNLGKRSVLLLEGALLLLLGILTWSQCRVYTTDETLYRATLEWNPSCWLAHNNLGLTVLRSGKPEEAIEEYRKALHYKPDYAEAHNNLGNAYLDKGRITEATSEFSKAAQCNPHYAEAYANLGNALVKSGRIDEAIAKFELALKIQPDLTLVRYNLGNAFLQKRQFGEAIGHYQEALKAKPDFAQAHYNLAAALLEENQTDGAIWHLERAIENKPDFAEAENNLGSALLQKGRVDEGVGHYRKALRINPEFAEAYFNLGNALLEKGRLADAVTAYEKATEITPRNVQFQSSLGVALAKIGNRGDALSHLEAALDLQPNDWERHRLLGIAYAMDGRPRQAAKQFELALEIRRDDPGIEKDLAKALWQDGRVREAIVHYNNALKADPPLVDALKELALLLATTPDNALRDGKRASELAFRAWQLSNERDPVAGAALAAAYAERGDFANASKTAQRAMDLAASQGQTSLVETIRSNAKLYRENKPLRLARMSDASSSP